MYTIMLYLYMHSYKSKSYLLFISYTVLHFLIWQYSTIFYNITIYYQLISCLNTKNNIIAVIILYIIVNKLLYNGKSNVLCCLLLYVIVYNYNIVVINKLYYIYYMNSCNQLNLNLTNGVMLIHPLILYLFYSFYLNCLVKSKNNASLKQIKKLPNKYTMLNSLLLIIVAIILGSWWAEQELSWGGWWSWDFVELLALNYLIMKLFLIHKNGFSQENFKIKALLSIMICVFVVFVRFNVVNSIHNFVNLQSNNQYYWYLLILVTVFVCYTFSLFRLFLGKRVNLPTLLLSTTLFYFVASVVLNMSHYDVNAKTHYLFIIVIIAALFLVKFFHQLLRLDLFLYLSVVICYNQSGTFLLITLLGLSYIVYSSFSINKSLKYIHMSCILLLFYSTCQFFVFKEELSSTKINSVMYYSITNVNNSSSFIELGLKKMFFLNYNFSNNFVVDFKKNTDIFNSDYFKSTFDKIIYYNLLIQELYSYNFQRFYPFFLDNISLILLSILYYIITLFKKELSFFF